jgi:hypothetical protein
VYGLRKSGERLGFQEIRLGCGEGKLRRVGSLLAIFPDFRIFLTFAARDRLTFKTGRGMTWSRTSSTPAQPYRCRFSAFRRLIWPSTGPLLDFSVNADSMASRSCLTVRRKHSSECNPVLLQALIQNSSPCAHRILRNANESLLTTECPVAVVSVCRRPRGAMAAGYAGQKAVICLSQQRGFPRNRRSREDSVVPNC